MIGDMSPETGMNRRKMLADYLRNQSLNRAQGAARLKGIGGGNYGGTPFAQAGDARFNPISANQFAQPRGGDNFLNKFQLPGVKRPRLGVGGTLPPGPFMDPFVGPVPTPGVPGGDPVDMPWISPGAPGPYPRGGGDPVDMPFLFGIGGQPKSTEPVEMPWLADFIGGPQFPKRGFGFRKPILGSMEYGF